MRFGSLGDVILSFAACAALARGRADLEIHYLVKEPYAELVRAQPWAAGVLALAEADRTAEGARRWRARLRAERWDAVLDLQGNGRSHYLARGLAPHVVRWQGRGIERRLLVWTRRLRGLGLTPPVVRPAWLRFHDAALLLGAAPAEPPAVHVPAEARSRAERFLAEHAVDESDRVVAVAPAAAWATKEWPEHHLLALTEHLVADGHRPVFVSTAAERARLPRLAACVAGEPRAAWFTGELTTAAALLAVARAALTPDSGLMHLAAAVGTPVVALFGSTVPELGFAPAGAGHRLLGRPLGCRPCAVHGRRACPLGHFACLTELTPHEVRLALAETLAESERARLR
jgi:ADP-heptose:LPS heptosyltransferase